MGLLDRATRQHLLTILGAMPALDTSVGRRLLLQYLPQSLCNQIIDIRFAAYCKGAVKILL